MTENNKISEFITFGRTFEGYKWYKPILVLIITIVMQAILSLIIFAVFGQTIGLSKLVSIISGGYEVLNNEIGLLISMLGMIVVIPSLYIATKIVKDRPFSSYSSSRGGWNHKLYFKSLIVPFIIYIIYEAITITVKGAHGTNHFSISLLLISLFIVPLQCIAEEHLFRGLIMQTFGSWFNIPILAVILQTIVFAVVHSYNIIGLIGVVSMGFILGFFAWKTNGLEVSSAVHSVNNMVMSLTVMFGLETSTSTISLGNALSGIALQIVILVVMYYVGTKTEWFGEIKKTA